MEHVLPLCPLTIQVWFKGPLNYRVDQMDVATLDAWIMVSNEHSGNLDDKKFLLTVMAFTYWNIWKDRCKTIFNRKHPSPIRTIHAIVGDVELFLKAKALAHIPSVPHSQTPDHRRSWTPPPPHMLKINVDVSCKTGCGREAVGVMMMDYLSRCLAVKSKEIAAQSVYVAEAMAVIEGCLLAHQQNLSQVVVESNCKHIITCLLDNMENAH
ncbi:hypothetical protein COP2_025374 [Malus domestica]